MTLKETLKSPVAKVTGGLTAITAILQPDILLAVGEALIASGPQLFSVVSISALTLPRILPPESTADWVVIAAALVFAAYLLREINKNFENRGL